MITTRTSEAGNACYSGTLPEMLSLFSRACGDGYGDHHGATVDSDMTYPVACIRGTDPQGSHVRLFIGEWAWISVDPSPAMVAARQAAMDRHPAGKGR